MNAPKKDDNTIVLGEGATLFHQGDPGGDLFFIQEGRVEIFVQKNHQDVILTEMGAGEIIGVMTCLTNEPRMASARAKTDVICKRVPHIAIKKMLDSLPNWMRIVLKEFTIRLKEMNKNYSEAQVMIRRLRKTQLSSVYTGAQIASAFAVLAEYMAFSMEEKKLVVVEDVMDKLEQTLNIRREELDRVFAVLLEAGLMKLEIEPEKKRTVTTLENAKKLAYFAEFVREAKSPAIRRLMQAKFTHKETRVLSAIVKLAARLDMDLTKTCKFSIAELTRSLERSTGVRFEIEALEKGKALKLLELTGEEGNQTVVFKPATLGRTVACVEAVRKLRALDEAREEKALEAA